MQTTTNCDHQDDSTRRHFTVAWSSEQTCEACLAALAAQRRSTAPFESEVAMAWSGRAGRAPTLCHYDRVVAQERLSDLDMEVERALDPREPLFARGPRRPSGRPPRPRAFA